MAKPKAKDLLMIAGANGNLSNKEANKIAKKSGKDLDQVISKAVGSGLTLGRNLVNNYNAGPNSLDPIQSNDRGGSPGLARGNSSPTIYSQIRNAGTLDKGSVLSIGSKGSTSTVLPKSLVTGSAGGKTASSSTSRTPGPYDSAFNDALDKPLSERVAANPKGPWSIQTLKDTGYFKPASSTDTTEPTETKTETAAPLPPPPPPDKMGVGGASADLDGGAKGFRKNRSSARRAGLTTKGTSQFKISMAQGAKSGLNIGY